MTGRTVTGRRLKLDLDPIAIFSQPLIFTSVGYNIAYFVFVIVCHRMLTKLHQDKAHVSVILWVT